MYNAFNNAVHGEICSPRTGGVRNRKNGNHKISDKMEGMLEEEMRRGEVRWNATFSTRNGDKQSYI